MNIEGLDYNTQRDKLVLPEYGREIQKMVEHAIGLPTKEERQRCAETIVSIMARMNPQHRESGDYMQKLWDHLAIMSGFRLDIDYPYDVAQALKLAGKPEPVSYPTKVNSVRHYGRMMGDMFETENNGAGSRARCADGPRCESDEKVSRVVESWLVRRRESGIRPRQTYRRGDTTRPVYLQVPEDR